MKMSIKARKLGAAQKALRELMRDVEIESEEMLAVMLMGISANTAPYVPVATSNLINSEYRKTWKAVDGYGGEIGYNARYAVPVHEGPQKNWQKPGASNKFLLRGVKDFVRDDLSGILARYQP